MTEPQVSVRVEGERLSPSQGLSNLINISIDSKWDEILENPTTGSRTLSGRTLQTYIRQLLQTKLNTSFSLYEFLASKISVAATDLGFSFNGFFMNIFVTITYYYHTVELADPPANLNDDTIEEFYRMILLGRIRREELESLKIETESCSICLDDLSSSNSKYGLTRMTCSHVFHEYCLLEWLSRKNTCPLCRTVLYDQ